MTALGDLLGRLDPDPGRRGRQFEHICQWFLTHDPVYAHELRHVWLWDEWPGRWGADAGIDLVAEDHRGQLWAVQAKAYDGATWITKRDVETFLAESGRSKFSFRLLIATTNLMRRIGERTIQDQEKRVTFFRLSTTFRLPTLTGPVPPATSAQLDRTGPPAPASLSVRGLDSGGVPSLRTMSVSVSVWSEHPCSVTQAARRKPY